ncbi:MAG: hypothetical protein KDB80_06245, partial [Planctomycetes bacterium]|nr:hypothetical protein [Planctomycetota bacterium]
VAYVLFDGVLQITLALSLGPTFPWWAAWVQPALGIVIWYFRGAIVRGFESGEGESELLLPTVERLLAAGFAGVAVFVFLGKLQVVGTALFPLLDDPNGPTQLTKSTIVPAVVTCVGAAVLFFKGSALARWWCRSEVERG